jgi:hypothetical protein
MKIILISGYIHIRIGKAPAVRAAISFLYTGVADISYKTVMDILEVADYFRIDDLISYCRQYLQNITMTVDNCLQVCLMCSLYNLDLYEKFFDYLRGHLPAVMQQEDALTLTFDSVVLLLTDETLLYVEQKQFYEFIIKWVEFDIENREEFFPHLFCLLDLKRIPREVLEKEIDNHPLVKKNESCKAHVMNVKTKYITGMIKADDGTREAILVAGGFQQMSLDWIGIRDVAISRVFAYIVAENRWIKFASLPCPMRQACVAFCTKKNCLYVYDQDIQTFISNEYIFKFDFNESKWSSFKLELPGNLTSGNIQTILTCAGKLYAVVLFYGWSTFVVEIKEDISTFDIKQYLFQQNESTNVLACTMQNEKICILANKVGINPHAREHSIKFLVFDTSTNTIDDQSEGAGWGTLMIPVGDEIIVTEMGKSSCSRYSFDTREWRHTEEQFLPFPLTSFERTGCSSISDDSNFYLFSRHTQSLKPSSKTLCYNFNEKKWGNLPALSKPLQQSATCLVQLPRNFSKCHINCPHCPFSKRATYDTHDLRDILVKKSNLGII